MTSIRHTFIPRPDTQLATIVKGVLAGQRAEDTRFVEQTVLIAPAPTAFNEARTRIAAASPSPSTPATSPAASSPAPFGGAPAPPQDRYARDDYATVIIGSGATVVGATRPSDDGAPAERRPAMIRKSLPEGFTVHRYRINGIIGEGGFGITYRARDLTIDREVAIKELFLPGTCFRTHGNEVMISRPEQDERVMQWAKFYFSEEARITFSLRHEGVVRIYDFFKTNNTAYIVYEMLQGADLQNWGKANRHAIRHGQAIDLLRSTCDALRHVHMRGFVHRDLKPANIFITSDLNRPILIDFGAASALGSAPAGDGAIISPGYSPPEQYRLDAALDARTDIYALCATLYWTLSGQAPPDAPGRLISDELVPLRRMVDPSFKLGDRLYRVIEQGMSLKREDRYDSVDRLVDDLAPKYTLPSTGYSPSPRGERIFVSYRRDDSAHFSGRLLDFLEMRFGAAAVFFDVESIPAGTDFWDYIKEILGDCAVMLVVIGPSWLETLQQRRKRWYQPLKKDDYVALEIKAAIEMEVPIVPVLFDDAAMPKASSLPRTMRQMAMLNAAIIGQGKAFRAGADGICDQVVRIKSSLGRASARATQSPKI